jgi:hypothetical protein
LVSGDFPAYARMYLQKEAYDEGGYEASNALFSYKTGNVMVDKTAQLLRTM